MFDINEIKKRAQQASERAADAMKETFEKSEEIVKKAEEPDSKKSSAVSALRLKNKLPLIPSAKWKFSGRCLEQTVWLRWLSMRNCCKRW